MRLYKIIKKPIVTEKASNIELSNNCYTVVVSSDATKVDIKKAFSELYKLEVENVNIINTREKFKYWKKWISLRRRSTKKAYVTLKSKKAKLDLISVK